MGNTIQESDIKCRLYAPHGVRVVPEITGPCAMKKDATIDASALVTVGEGFILSSGAYLITHRHGYSDSRRPMIGNHDIELIAKIIGDDVFIGERALVLPRANLIHRGCIIGAGAVLTKPTEGEYLIYGGNPAVVIGRRG
jgi:acetyltransferase-like isoleucine patch superfamily enzyme